jgi:hypothetical protein
MRHRFDIRTWARWVASFVGFPLAGLAAKGVAGPIDGAGAALAGGLAAGAVLGAVQALALPTDRSTRLRWIGATSGGMAAGLALGATAVDFATDATSLTVMGAVTGAGVGLAQMTVLTTAAPRRLGWAVASSVLWALGWLITSQVIVDADSQFSNFGASGAIVATLLGGLLLAIRPVPVPSAGRGPVPVPQGAH